MPEARIVLAQAAAYVACAPKSNSAIMAIDSADAYVKSHPGYRIPSYLMDAHYKGAAKLGHGIGYLYAHDFPEHYVKQQYLPDEIAGRTFYRPGELGQEKEIAERLKRLRERDG